MVNVHPEYGELSIPDSDDPEWGAEIFICPTVNLPDANGLGGHSHLYQCNDCQKFVKFEQLADCPRHDPPDDIDDLVDWQLQQQSTDTITARCLTHGTEWDAEGADFCPDCQPPR